MKPLDWFFLTLSLVLTLGTGWMVFAPSNTPLRVEVQDSGGTSIYPIDVDRAIQAKGPLGITTVHIAQRGVFVHDSPCTNKVCIAMGTIHSPGQFVACLPNKVFVRITGSLASQEVPDAGVW